MRIMMKTLILSLSLTLGVAAAAHAEKPAAAKTAKVKVDWKRFEQHLREHQQYPATKADLVAACNNLTDFGDAEKKWFAASVPEGNYKSADDVIKTLRAAK